MNRGTNAAPTSGQTAPYTLFSYDADGRQTYRERRYDGGSLRQLTFGWDGDDRLRSVNEGSTNRITAVYDGDGTRVSKTENWTGTAITHNYSWGPDGLLYDSNQNTIYTPGLSQQVNGVDRYFAPDWLGSSRYLSDSTGNSFPSALRFDAFGNRSATGGTDAYDPSDFQFGAGAGYQTEYASTTEPGLGLQYLDQRYYDPVVGRFVTQDPLGLEAGLNLYSYCGNDPVNVLDPRGLVSVAPLLDALVLGYDASLVANSVRQHDPGGVALNSGILLLDGLLTIVPFVPPAIGEARAVATLVKVGSRPVERLALVHNQETDFESGGVTGQW